MLLADPHFNFFEDREHNAISHSMEYKSSDVLITKSK